MPATPSPPRPRFLLIVALANAGGVIGFLPLLTLLLPMKIDAIAPDARIGIVTVTTILGAIAASVSNIAFGAWSDRVRAAGGGRRVFVGGGLTGTVASFALIALATTPGAIVAAVVLFQVAVNAMLGPFLAIVADEVPDEHKGIAGGLLALATPLASAVSTGTLLFANHEAARLALVALAMTALTLPLLFVHARATSGPRHDPGPDPLARQDLVATWVARLLVQISGTVLLYFLLFYFQSVTSGLSAQALATRTGQLMTIAFIVPLPVAVLFGRLSDRTGVRKPFLLVAALLAATGLLAMATADDWQQAAVGFSLYAVGSATFLALHATFAMQLLPTAEHRGRDLGLLNLTNTLPSLIGPALAWLLATPNDFSALMVALAVLTALGGAAMLGVRGRR